ncbi:MAG: hypothetical protein Tsb0017_00400 [Geothermobacteraceae bacterium]
MDAMVVDDESAGCKVSGSVSRRQLADRLNRLNFLEEPAVVQFSHRKYGQIKNVEVLPLPCDGDSAVFAWSSAPPENIASYRIDRVVLPGTPQALVFEPVDTRLSDRGFRCRLPRQGFQLPSREFARVRPKPGVRATISQHGVCFEGVLIDCTARALCVEVPTPTPNSRHWITEGQDVHLSLSASGETLFSGGMRVLRTGNTRESLLFVLAPLKNNTPRFPNKRHRAFRTRLLPAPSLAFHHPLTGRYHELELVDLSALGGCVEVVSDRSILLPGMVLPQMRIKFGTGFEIPCRGQVVYRNETEGEQARARCGLSLLDIDAGDHLRLFSLLQRARNRHAYLNPEIDIESLWEFFFETGFIYPTKYLQLAGRKAGFRETFRRTYLEQTPIARHFTFQAEGQVLAHISAVRMYEQTWFKQHHAARRLGKHAVGLEVITQLAEYFYNASFLSRDKIGYVAGFYRPQNRFPSKYYRAIVGHLKNPRAASIDAFSYFGAVPETRENGAGADIHSGWHLSYATRGDLDELNGFYEQVSGGCMIDAMDLRPALLGRDNLEREYRQLGLMRRRHLFSIRRQKELMAIIDVHQSDTDLSLSRMDRAIVVYVLDEQLPHELLTAMVRRLVKELALDNPPLMTFPHSWAEKQALGYEKVYEMMVLNILYAEDYMQFLNEFIARYMTDS